MYQIKQGISKVQDNNWLTEEWVNDFWNKEKHNFRRLFAKVNHFSKSFSSSKITHPHIPHIDSKIIDSSTQLVEFFDKKIMSFKTLYRASDNNFDIAEFHKKCDKISKFDFNPFYPIL